MKAMNPKEYLNLPQAYKPKGSSNMKCLRSSFSLQDQGEELNPRKYEVKME